MSSPPFTVKAVFEYASDHADDLTFSIGQIITVKEEEDDDWYFGEYTDSSGARKEGLFPKNFVEKYDPPAPPRPTRPARAKKEPEPVAAPEPVETAAAESQAAPEPEPEPEHEAEPEPVQEKEPAPQRVVSPPPAAAAAAPEIPTSPPRQAPAPAPAPAPAQSSAEAPQSSASKPPPPAKPAGSSFRDRIAAFNKPAAPPIAPFKPGGLSSQTFIKKPFVAPPPSKNAYIPQPREPPPKIYRREEDPEVANREPPVSESRPVSHDTSEDATEEQPKPTSLKERIALLQKQQLEQAARHADAAAKKEKPKKPPPKKQPPPQEQVPAESAEMERTDTDETTRDPATEAAKAHQPSRELMSDTNDADYSAAADTEDADETSTSREDTEERPPRERKASKEEDQEEGEEGEGEEEAEGEEEEEEEDIDPEVKRRMELRERMAKMSGGMGMMGMFGPPAGLPGMPPAGARKPKPPAPERKQSQDSERAEPAAHAPPIPIMALPGMNARKTSETTPQVEKEEDNQAASITEQHPADEVSDIEDVAPAEPPRSSIDRPAPPPPQARPVPPPVPSEQPTSAPPVPGSRPVPPPPPRSPVSSKGEESDDELSVHARNLSLNAVAAGQTPARAAPPVPDQESSPRSANRSSVYSSNSPTSPTVASEKRLSRPPPPIPTNPPQSPTQTRAPPPVPSMSRRSTTDSKATSVASAAHQAGEGSEGEVTEYDGDYDTDIASGVKFKDALKSHGRDSSIDDGTITDEPSLQSPVAPESRPPPPPPNAPRAVPPPPPGQPPRSRGSVDMPRTAPPPPPAPKEQSLEEDDEYDPYRYNAPAPRHGAPPPPPPPPSQPRTAETYDELYDASPVQTQAPPPPPPHDRRSSVAPPPPTQASSGPPPSSRGSRQSVDLLRNQGGNSRRSMDISRPSLDQGHIAMDVDLGQTSLWWTAPNTLPPVFQNRKDLFYEIEESSFTKRGGKTIISKDVYVLFMDYSQTVITVQYDARSPSDASFEQRHESPPNRPRQDQLEQAHQQFGTRISDAVNAVQNTTVADGTPHALVQHLLSPLKDALLPVGTRAYGALVYSNLANASVQQNDEIRAGDIVSFRNARFQGHRGTMHQKYNTEVGKPDHVGIVVDWDGTKKKIRAWEQGRESKKVKMESFKLGDLKSGECKVWRVMPRSWVGWDSGKE
ncbi:assembly of actin patch protein [Paecilomyces lecythidis]